MQIDDKAINLIVSFEGEKLTAYPDPGTGGDPWTIGVGHTGPDVHPGLTITEDQSRALLHGDLAKFETGVTGLIGQTPTTQDQFDALVCFAFNVGLNNLRNSTLLRKHCARDYGAAADQFGLWDKAAGRVLLGLQRRRAAEADLYRGEA